MRSVSTKSLLHGVCRLAGLDPTRDLSTARAGAIVELMNQRLAEGWRFEFWPEITVSEERTVVGDEKLLPRTETDLRTIEDLAGVYAKNPRLYPNAPKELEFEAVEDGWLLPRTAPATVWARYRTAPPELTATLWSAATVYAAGDLVYRTADTYKALAASTNQDPLTDPNWARVEVPALLEGWIKRAVYSDILRGERQQTDRAAVELQLAKDELEDTWDRVMAGQRQWDTATVKLS